MKLFIFLICFCVFVHALEIRKLLVEYLDVENQPTDIIVGIEKQHPRFSWHFVQNAGYYFTLFIYMEILA
jgi:hypothetical protein